MSDNGLSRHALGARCVIVAEADAFLDPHRARMDLGKHERVRTMLLRPNDRIGGCKYYHRKVPTFCQMDLTSSSQICIKLRVTALKEINFNSNGMYDVKIRRADINYWHV